MSRRHHLLVLLFALITSASCGSTKPGDPVGPPYGSEGLLGFEASRLVSEEEAMAMGGQTVVGFVTPGTMDVPPFYALAEPRPLRDGETVRRWMYLEGHPPGAVIVESNQPAAIEDFILWTHHETVVVGESDHPGTCLPFHGVRERPFEPQRDIICFDSLAADITTLDRRRVIVRRRMRATDHE